MLPKALTAPQRWRQAISRRVIRPQYSANGGQVNHSLGHIVYPSLRKPQRRAPLPAKTILSPSKDGRCSSQGLDPRSERRGEQGGYVYYQLGPFSFQKVGAIAKPPDIGVAQFVVSNVARFRPSQDSAASWWREDNHQDTSEVRRALNRPAKPAKPPSGARSQPAGLRYSARTFTSGRGLTAVSELLSEARGAKLANFADLLILEYKCRLPFVHPSRRRRSLRTRVAKEHRTVRGPGSPAEKPTTDVDGSPILAHIVNA